MSLPTPQQLREGVASKLRILFSGDETSIASATEVAAELRDMPGVQSFHTPLSWRLILSSSQVQSGNSVDLVSAASEITGQLLELAKAYPSDTKIRLAIDELHHTKHISPSVGHSSHGK